ncbi:hypothetical protein CEUSTIGMA_g3994.t1 [Chlamydomonas eustigma]|uniref:Uncharacterized protein n=1 Tax=Chlamydomonas eustigma TaxID=1157962 RepID=A0A250X0F1_9CHLO|nr:hypothetical protein CEUSTIGMA_g3994.t1 [Chlamydomonas eustigma]|eukprot:GAX76548.1 hypothetical protein CEUSTIGMA_g3994.t1 [Chlamydomonas eustigma]
MHQTHTIMGISHTMQPLAVASTENASLQFKSVISVAAALGNWHATYCICAAFMGSSMGKYFMGSLKGHQYTDYRKYYEAEEAAAIAAEAVQVAPCHEDAGNMTRLGKADEGEDESMSLLSVDDAEPSHSVSSAGGSKSSKRGDMHAASPFQAENDDVGGNGGAAMPVTHPFQVSKSSRSLAPGYYGYQL